MTPAAGAELSQPGLEGRDVDEASFLLSSRRTRLSFQRTRMSADRTLMSIIRTALSLIGFGFTIFQFFRFLRGSADVALPIEAARNFGVASSPSGSCCSCSGSAATSASCSSCGRSTASS